MPPFTTRNQCSKEPAKHVPTETKVKVCKVPRNFPRVCKKMIGKIYSAFVYMDRQGNVWYNIPKDELAFELVRTDPEKVSFTNRKNIKLPAEYCN